MHCSVIADHFQLLRTFSLTFQFIEQKQWISENFPKDRRFETIIGSAENVLTADYMRYVSTNYT